MSTLEELNRFTAKLAEQVAELSGEVRNVRQRQDELQLAIENAEDSAYMAGVTLSAWGPTLGRLLPEFKVLHWPDIEQVVAAPNSAPECQYLIERLSRLLAEIALAVYGPPPQGTSWGYDQLPALVAALKAQAKQAQGSLNA